MMYYIESSSHDARFNLALEQYVFDKLDRTHGYVMLWRNRSAVIIGKHQNTVAEVNAAYVKEHDIQVVRRLSGGGAVYHDLGNINFTFIVDADGSGAFDFATFCGPVVRALARHGVEAEIGGRNDVTIGGRKFSGNSQYVKRGRIMHHGTILYDSDLEMVTRALNVPADKISSKGLQSVRSRVTNVRPHMREPLPVEGFQESLRAFLFEEYDLLPYTLTVEDLREVSKLQAEVYDRWEWNYGSSPAYDLRKERRVAGCGLVQVGMQVEQGVIQDLMFHGDFFSGGEPGELAGRLLGCRVVEEDLREALRDIDVAFYFHGMDEERFLRLMLE